MGINSILLLASLVHLLAWLLGFAFQKWRATYLTHLLTLFK